MISNRISDDIAPKMKKKMNIVIPILMYFVTINIENASFFISRERNERLPITSAIAHDVVFPTVYRRKYCRKFFDFIQLDVALHSQVH